MFLPRIRRRAKSSRSASRARAAFQRPIFIAWSSEAEQYAAEDKRRREVIEARNQADALIYGTEKELKEHGDRLTDADRRAVEEAVAALRTAMSGDDAGRIRQGIEALSRAAMRIGEAAQRSAQTDRGTGGTGGPADDRVVDAEVEDVDDTKRHAS